MYPLKHKPHIWLERGVWCCGYRRLVWGTGMTVIDAWRVFECWWNGPGLWERCGEIEAIMKKEL